MSGFAVIWNRFGDVVEIFDSGRSRQLAGELVVAVPPSRWAGSADQENLQVRAQLLTEANELMNRAYGHSVTCASAFDPRLGLSLGRYVHDERLILVNGAVLLRSTPTDALGALVHEQRHALQYHEIDRGLDFAEVERWRAARDSYGESREDVVAYKYNSLEVDAALVERSVLAAYWELACSYDVRQP